MSIKFKKFLLFASVLAVIILGFSMVALASPPDPYISDDTPTSVPTTGFQGWGAFEFSVPTVGGSYDTDTTYVNHWYAVGTWGNNPSDGRGALYADVFDNASILYINSNDSVWLSGLNYEYQKEFGVSAYDSASGAWKLFDYTYNNFVTPNPQWISILDSHAGTQPAYPLPANLQDNNPQYLGTADGESGSAYSVEYYPNGGFDIFNPMNGIYQGNGLSTGWFANWVFTPPDIAITVDAGNAGQPVPAGRQVTGTWTITNNSDMTWTGNKVQLYLADSEGNILSTIGTVPNLSLTAGGTYSQQFTWTMPSGQPNGVEVAGSVNELLSNTLVPSSSNGSHVTISSPNNDSPYDNPLSDVQTNADSNWSNNLSIVPVSLAQSSGGSTSPALTITPASATVGVGATQQYEDLYWPNGTGGSSQDVTQSSFWLSGSTGIATVGSTGVIGGFATGVSPGTTSIEAQYDDLSASASITVEQNQGDLAVTNLEAGVSSNPSPGSMYTATATFSNSFSTPDVNGSIRIDWYINSGSGFQEIGNPQYLDWNPTSSTLTDTQTWEYPSSGPSNVTIRVTIDDPYNDGSFNPMNYPPTNQGEVNYDNNYQDASVGYSAPVTVSGTWNYGYVQVPETITTQQQVTKNYNYPVYTWKNVPIIPGPPPHYGKVHFFLSY